ncbi:MAG: AcrR family transcriptional regulator [Candidatus Azotimanducaceae bacterium]
MKQQYHHGNLREALIEEAIRLLEIEGLAGLTLRRVAREVGVSQAAPYSHFKDKQALLLAVCVAGYDRFSERMRTEAGGSTGPAYIAGLGRGYIYFALENPALFQLMFDGELQDLPESAPSGPNFGEGYRMLDRGLAQFPIPYFEDDALSRAISWGVVHGLAQLLLSGRMKPEHHGYDGLDEFIRSTMDKFVGGVELSPVK